MSKEKSYRKVSETEYEVQINGRTKSLSVPFAKVEKIFHAFISNGGIIDPATGQVQTEILPLITSFKDVGNILLTEYSDDGKVVVEGNCTTLGTSEVVVLFKVATEIVELFIQGLMALQKEQTPLVPNQGEEN